jgi:hypothetical protein
MALIKHPWTSMDIAAGNRGSTPLASKSAIYQINDIPLVTPVYVGEAGNRAWRLMEQLSGWSHSELWHKTAPYSEISAWYQLLQGWTTTQVAVVDDVAERKAQEDQIIKSLRPPLNRHHLLERYR